MPFEISYIALNLNNHSSSDSLTSKQAEGQLPRTAPHISNSQKVPFSKARFQGLTNLTIWSSAPSPIAVASVAKSFKVHIDMGTSTVDEQNQVEILGKTTPRGLQMVTSSWGEEIDIPSLFLAFLDSASLDALIPPTNMCVYLSLILQPQKCSQTGDAFMYQAF